MASPSEHARQWRHNRSLVPLFLDYPDWIVTVTFYAALHVVDALLAADKVSRITSHDARNDVLKRTNRYHDIWKRFAPLYNLSRTVRYLANPGDWIPAEAIERQVLNGLLYPIEASVARKLPDLESPPPIQLGMGPRIRGE